MKNQKINKPILYSFRRCPYAMRARLALLEANQKVEIREILLKEKPVEFLQASPSSTVPCLLIDDKIIDESLDIMTWALNKNDPGNFLDMPDLGYDLINENDGPFKLALDKTKYHSRYPDENPKSNREKASSFIHKLENILEGSFLFGEDPKLADLAVLPFIRQFALVDKIWFDQQPWQKVVVWLNLFLESKRFTDIQQKYVPWKSGTNSVFFP
tara:strand:+ start:443 stop:1084 length:642 start_codon:yes stop_codon:yes gene_type:complete